MIRWVLDRLWKRHGRREFDGGDDVLGVLVRTILSQATSRDNASEAFGSLLDRFGGEFDPMRRASVDDIADAIQVGGLANQKAPRIQAILEKLHEETGEYSLEFVRDMEPEAARDYLAQFRGVGPKTATFTLMYAANMDLFPMNGGILRVLRRLGILTGSESDAAAHAKMQEEIPAGQAYPAHMVLVRHARELCTARAPECGRCPLAERCRGAGSGDE